jgi:hypothetical protein
MGSPPCLRLVLDLERGRDPVRGWLESPDGVRERFEGLLGLLVVLEAARGADRVPADWADDRAGEG